jgi:hypothetical protein
VANQFANVINLREGAASPDAGLFFAKRITGAEGRTAINAT